MHRRQNQNYPKISMTIPARLRNDKEKEIIQTCRQKNIKFTDPQFPTSVGSLIGNPPEAGADREWPSYKWARAEEVFGRGEFAVFNDISPDDIRQGEMGNCYFLCALSSLAENPGLIKRLFDTTHPNEFGVYAVWLNVDGMWTEFVLDDFFPVIDNGRGAVQFAFSRTSEDEIWVMLLEKAYAKAYGNYHRIVGGDPVHALRDLTGAPFDRIEDMNEKSPDEIWNKVVQAERKGWVLCCYTQGTHVTEEQQSNGIVSGHAYSLLRAEEVTGSDGRRHRIFQIRNPWGGFEWNGNWSDRSPLWTPELMQKLNVQRKDDGIFWISLEDFIRNYEGIGICKVNPANKYNCVKLNQKGKGRKSMVRFDVYTAGEYTMSIDQKDCRHFPGDQYRCAYVRVTIGRITNNNVEFVDCVLTPDRNIFCEENIQPGKYVALIEFYWEDNFTRQFTFSVYGPEMAGIKKMVANDNLFQSTEYLIWKNFAKTRSNKFQDEGKFPISRGFELSKSGYQSQNYAVSITKWKNHSGQGTVEQVIRTPDAVGFDIISEFTNGNQHTLKINPNNIEVIIFKMDPRQEEFGSSIETVDIDVHRNDIPDDISAVKRLSVIDVGKPVEGSTIFGIEPQNPQPYNNNNNFNPGPKPAPYNNNFNPSVPNQGPVPSRYNNNSNPVPNRGGGGGGFSPYGPGPGQQQPGRYNNNSSPQPGPSPGPGRFNNGGRGGFVQPQPFNNGGYNPRQPPNAYDNNFDQFMPGPQKGGRGGGRNEHWFDFEEDEFFDPFGGGGGDYDVIEEWDDPMMMGPGGGRGGGGFNNRGGMPNNGGRFNNRGGGGGRYNNGGGGHQGGDEEDCTLI